MKTTLAPVTRSVVVRCPPERAFTLFTEGIGAWWPLGTHTVFPDEESTLRFEDDHLVERMSDGCSDTWGEVLASQAPCQLSFTWHPGRPEGPDTVVLVTFEPADTGTLVTVEHTGWEVFGAQGEERRSAYDNDQGWSMVVQQLAEFIQ